MFTLIGEEEEEEKEATLKNASGQTQLVTRILIVLNLANIPATSANVQLGDRGFKMDFKHHN